MVFGTPGKVAWALREKQLHVHNLSVVIIDAMCDSLEVSDTRVWYGGVRPSVGPYAAVSGRFH